MLNGLPLCHAQRSAMLNGLPKGPKKSSIGKGMRKLVSAEELAAARAIVHGVGFLTLSFTPVLEGRMSGSVFGDGARVLVANRYGMSLLCGPVPEDGAEWLVEYLRPTRRAWMEWLQVWPCAPWLAFLESRVAGGPLPPFENGRTSVNQMALCERVNYHLDAAPREMAEKLGHDLVLCPLSRAHFDSIAEGSVIPSNFWKDRDAWIDGGGAGFVVLSEGRPVCWAFSSAVSPTHLELGIETVPAWRGRGLARVACFALLNYCRKCGLEPVWCCRRSNEASCRVAESLGFREITYKFGPIPYVHLPLSVSPDVKDVRSDE